MTIPDFIPPPPSTGPTPGVHRVQMEAIEIVGADGKVMQEMTPTVECADVAVSGTYCKACQHELYWLVTVHHLSETFGKGEA